MSVSIFVPLFLVPYLDCDSGFISLQSHASQILGFKFQYFQRMEVNSPVPTGLYQLTALMVKKGFINIDSM